MYKINAAGNIMIVLGFLTTAVALLVFMWPLWVAIIALFLASGLFSFLSDKKEMLAEKITPVIVRLRSKPQLAGDKLFSVSESTAVR